LAPYIAPTITATMEHDISIVPIGYQDSTNSAYDTLPSSTPSQTRPDAPKSTTFATTSSIHRLDSKEGSNNWRFQTPKYGLTTHPNARPEPRPFVNKYFFKRPRLLQYYSDGAIVDSRGHKLAGPGTPAGEFALSTTTSGAASSFDSTPEHLVEESSDPGTSKIQRDWLNLFIDLLWVGIISNISSSFVASAFSTSPSTPTWGYAFLEFMTLFLTAFRFWSYIRKFLNNFFRKDFFQSVFLTWVLVLAMFFGNQTPYFLDDAGGKWIIATFLVAKASFVAVEALYCFYIKEIRREFLLTFLISIPVTTLWASALGVSWPARAALMLPAVLLEGVVSAIIALPLGDWFLRGAPKKALDPDNFVDRLQGFFIIVLGEGVYGLIAGNNWGVGLNSRVSYAIEALMIYSAIFWLFFTGDQTKTYIHAIYRNRYTMLAFQG
jgi:low temperature requirement protein LtrA